MAAYSVARALATPCMAGMVVFGRVITVHLVISSPSNATP
jgi:hypothetical protein